MASKRKFYDDLGREWPTDMGDIEVGDSVWLGFVTVKILEFDPKVGSGSALYEWTSTDGSRKRHLGLPPLMARRAYHAEKKRGAK